MIGRGRGRGRGRARDGAGMASAPLRPVSVVAGSGRRQVKTAGDRRGVGVGAFLLAVVTVGALTHVAVRLKGLDVAYALGHERRVAADLEEQRRRLQIEIGMLKDPGRVVTIARDKLKMGPPAPEAIRPLGPGQILAAGLPPAPVPVVTAAAAAALQARPRTAAAATTWPGANGSSTGVAPPRAKPASASRGPAR